MHKSEAFRIFVRSKQNRERMLKAVKYRIYPDEGQREFFARAFGCCRFVYNLALDYRSDAWECLGFSMGHLDVSSYLLRWKSENPWLSEVPAQSLQMALRNLDAAYQNFFRRCARNRENPQGAKTPAGFPNHKSKKGRQSFQCPQSCSVDWKAGAIDIPKCKGIRAVLHRRLKGAVKTVTVSMDPSGRYHASVLFDTPEALPKMRPVSEDTARGFDFGLHDLLTCSDGRTWANPRWLRKALDRIKKLQKDLSLKYDPDKKPWEQSNNYQKARRKLARLCERVRNRRDDYLQKVSAEITRDSQTGTIGMEDLNVRGMSRNRTLAQAIMDVSWGRLASLIESKAARNGINFQKVGRFYASSQTCSHCGYINRSLKSLSVREWDCPVCGKHHHRDLNAAENIKAEALRLIREKLAARAETSASPGQGEGPAASRTRRPARAAGQRTGRTQEKRRSNIASEAAKSSA